MLALAYIDSHFQFPFLQSRPSAFLLVTSLTIMAVGVTLPFTPIGRYLRFTALPPLLGVHRPDALCYVLLTQEVKAWLLRHQVDLRAADTS